MSIVWHRRFLERLKVGLLVVFVFLIAVDAGAQPKPNPYLQSELDAKGITYAEWLLFEGIHSRNADYVKIALDRGADPNKSRRTFSDAPPLFAAVGSSTQTPEIIALLVARGADVHGRWTPRGSETSDANPALQLLMQKSGTEQNSAYFPLYWAALTSNAAIVEALLNAGADVHARTENLGMTALFATFDVEVGKVLLKHGADINARSLRGESVLTYAKRRITARTSGSENSALRGKAVAFHDWLKAQGAKE